MSEFSDNEFDMVFSNSVIEHVGSWEEQQRMAQEVARVGKAYFVQTPNFYFPYEPHYRIPMFQFLPRVMKIWILQYSLVPHLGRHTYENAVRAVDWVRLLTRKEISRLFPEAEIYVERLWGLPKSYVAWHVAPHAAAPANGEAGTR